MLPFVVAFAAFSRPGVLPMRPLAAPLVSKTPANVKMAFEGPALVSAANVILAMNLMPLGPTAYGLGMGGKQMSAGQKNWGNRVRASCSLTTASPFAPHTLPFCKLTLDINAPCPRKGVWQHHGALSAL